MNIGIDVDGTITDLMPFILKYGKEFAQKHNLIFSETFPNKNPKEIFGWPPEFNEKFWEEGNWIYANNVIIRENAKLIIDELKNQGHNIFIITSRKFACPEDYNPQMYNLLINTLKDNQIYYDKLLLTKNKIAEIKNHNIDIMIEDFPNNIIEISKQIPVIYLDCPYNKNYSTTNTICAKNWLQILDIINTLEN